jgi:hypothetical protein
MVDNCLLSSTQREELLSVLSFGSEDQWLHKYYAARLKEHLQEPAAET